MPRRSFLKQAAAGSAWTAWASSQSSLDGAEPGKARVILDTFSRPDSLYHGDVWESLNPGYWQIRKGALRRRLVNVGDRARSTGFPYHYETHQRSGGVMPVEYDPSLPSGSLYHRHWRMNGGFQLDASVTIEAATPMPGNAKESEWKRYQSGHAFVGLVVGAKNLLDSYQTAEQGTHLVLKEDGELVLEIRTGFKTGAGRKRRAVVNTGQTLRPGTIWSLKLRVGEAANGLRKLVGTARRGDEAWEVTLEVPREATEGYLGITARGWMDVSMGEVGLEPGAERPLHIALNACQVAYALGTTLRQERDGWRVKMIGLFRQEGGRMEVRVATEEHPEGGWEKVPVCGRAAIVSDRFRTATAVAEVRLPGDPGEVTHYYTVWLDGENVTPDVRLGTDAVGLGTGLVGDVPESGAYVGRLPRLVAPYRLCGLSCHAIHGAQAKLPQPGRNGGFFTRDQPTLGAYRHLDDYQFQILVWEDDVWYLELLLYPPSTDDAYKVITHTIAGPASRWQMMRHWNVINPGDHDYGMDDVKGPEQLVIRLRDGLGQDREYMRRNFQIVHHLITGETEISPTDNPKKWRAWKMPQKDFTLLVLDSRLWRTSQDTRIWDDEGWGHLTDLYDRADPTRALLGEEQFAWLSERIRTDSSRWICLTGINGLHTIWAGGGAYSHSEKAFAQRDRVAADYAGWVAAGADRVIELLGSREGVVTVYGDVHNGMILKNPEQGLLECSFGPIGRSGGREVIPGFGPRMQDVDGRTVEIRALYHAKYGSPKLEPNTGPFYWNFLEMVFDADQKDPEVQLRIRNLVDAPDEPARGGGGVRDRASTTGRPPLSRVPARRSLPDADVRIATLDGLPLRAWRTFSDGAIPTLGLSRVEPGTPVVMTVHDGRRAESHLVTTVAP